MALDQDITQLTRIPMLGALEDGALRLLAFSGETRLLRTGDVLFREGERASCGYFILTGAIVLETGIGGPYATRRTVSDGTLLGETALIRETIRPLTAMADRPSTVLRLSRTLFLRVLREHPVSAGNVQAFLARRLHERLGLPDEDAAAAS